MKALFWTSVGPTSLAAIASASSILSIAEPSRVACARRGLAALQRLQPLPDLVGEPRHRAPMRCGQGRDATIGHALSNRAAAAEPDRSARRRRQRPDAVDARLARRDR